MNKAKQNLSIASLCKNSHLEYIEYILNKEGDTAISEAWNSTLQADNKWYYLRIISDYHKIICS